MTDIQKFMQKNEPRFKLRVYKDEILELLYYGYTYQQILSFLKEYKKVVISESTLKRNANEFRKDESTFKTKKTNSTRVEAENKNENFPRKKLTPEEVKEKLLREG